MLESQVKALRDCQHPSGLWHTLLDDPDSYLEAPATAGFAYGIKAVRKRYLSPDYLPTGLAALRGVIANIDEDSELTGVFRYRHGQRPRLLSLRSAHINALWSGDGTAVPDGLPAGLSVTAE
ncbi:glycosyl hydrolase family 88|nr:glycosyl hydrolase family 88 [Candidatus Pantoea persica]